MMLLLWSTLFSYYSPSLDGCTHKGISHVHYTLLSLVCFISVICFCYAQFAALVVVLIFYLLNSLSLWCLLYFSLYVPVYMTTAVGCDTHKTCPYRNHILAMNMVFPTSSTPWVRGHHYREPLKKLQWATCDIMKKIYFLEIHFKFIPLLYAVRISQESLECKCQTPKSNCFKHNPDTR